MTRKVDIDSINIHLPDGWQGDTTLLARRIAQELQALANDLSSTPRLDIRLRGDYADGEGTVGEQFGQAVREESAKGRGDK